MREIQGKDMFKVGRNRGGQVFQGSQVEVGLQCLHDCLWYPYPHRLRLGIIDFEVGYVPIGVKFVDKVGEENCRICIGEKQVVRIGRDFVFGVPHRKALDVRIVSDFTEEWL